MAKDCRKPRTCNEGRCEGNHHPLLNAVLEERKRSQQGSSKIATAPRAETANEPEGNSSTNKSQNTVPLNTANIPRGNAVRTDSRLVSLKVVPVKVKAPDGDREVETYAFLDDGSDTTMCLQSLAVILESKIHLIYYVDQEISGRQLSLDVTGASTGKGVRITRVWTTDRLPITKENIIAKRDRCQSNGSHAGH